MWLGRVGDTRARNGLSLVLSMSVAANVHGTGGFTAYIQCREAARLDLEIRRLLGLETATLGFRKGLCKRVASWWREVLQLCSRSKRRKVGSDSEVWGPLKIAVEALQTHSSLLCIS